MNREPSFLEISTVYLYEFQLMFLMYKHEKLSNSFSR